MNKNKVRRFYKTIPQPQVIEPEEAQEIDYEICWCIEKLENMLVKSRNDKDKKYYQLSLKLLRNPETPLIMKRQMMRQHSGDYKKTIANVKKNSAIMSNINVQYVKKDEPRTTFIQKCHNKKNSSDENIRLNRLIMGTTKQNQKKVCGIELSDNSFRFNF